MNTMDWIIVSLGIGAILLCGAVALAVGMAVRENERGREE